MCLKQRTAKLSIKYSCSCLNQPKQNHANNLCPFSVLFWTILSLFLLRLVRSQELPVFVPILTDIIPKLQTYSIDKRKQLKWVHIPPSEWKQSTRKGIKLDVVAHNALVHAVQREWRGPNIAVGLIELLHEDSTSSRTNKEEIWGFEKKKHEEQEDQQIRSGLHEQEVPYGRERPMKWGELEKKTQLGLGNLG